MDLRQTQQVHCEMREADMNPGAQASQMDTPTLKARGAAPDGSPHIQVRNLNAFYGKVQALSNINIEIPRRQITVIMGPSGCGKSTLLKTFNRFLELTDGAKIAGEVLVDGQDIYAKDVDETEVRKRVGLLAQRPSPLPMSIYDNVVYGMNVHRMKTAAKSTRKLCALPGDRRAVGRGPSTHARSGQQPVNGAAAEAVPGARTGGGT
jgi:ABC-type multidrug transport system fused ATPase/permease subunit